jgi:hypothetical protein
MRPRTPSHLRRGGVAKGCTQRLTVARNNGGISTPYRRKLLVPRWARWVITWMMMGMKACKGSTCEALRESCSGLRMKLVEKTSTYTEVGMY